jgi:ubiquinone/menaquinone biosynthesis C-methylase UbiE
MPYRQVIAAAYDAGVGEEYSRLEGTPSGEAEYRLITLLLGEYVPDGSTVIDIGAGPGRYAEYLLQRNCKVGLVDLSAKSLKAFSDRIEKSGCRSNVIFNQVSCATQLNWIGNNTADTILLMGPMYHLVNEEHRNNALANCNRLLKPGGFLFTIFLTPNPFIHYESKKIVSDREKIPDHPHVSITATNFQGFYVPQFRCRPETAKKMMLDNGFETLRICNLDDNGSCFQYVCIGIALKP